MAEHAASFGQRNIVRPVIYHARRGRKLSTTRHKKGTHHREVMVTISVDGDEYALELRLNLGLLSQGHIVTFREVDGTVIYRRNKEEMELCQYTGQVKGKPNSWVAMSTCYGLRGAIHDGDRMIYIEPVQGNGIHSWHQVYEHRNVENDCKCGHETQDPKEFYEPVMEQGRQKRDRSFQERGFFNANNQTRYIELVLVADYAQYLGAERNLKALLHQLQEATNIVNAIFSPHNVFIALTGVEVWTVEDRITLDPNALTTLNRFYEYLPVLLKNIGHYDHAQLITETDFYKGHVGSAYLGSMCSPESCSIVYRPSRDLTAATIVKGAYNMVHELGHSLGMLHDTENCTCQDKHCIMSQKEQRIIPTRWSDCSLKVLRDNYIDGHNSSCLRNKPFHLYGPPSCGNGFIDAGEECDCGLTLDEEKITCYVCCNPETCQLKPNTTCLAGACCNSQCQFKPAGSVCRAAEFECDLPEYCDGQTEYCPGDVFKMDAVPCFGEICESQTCIVVDDPLLQIIRRHSSRGCLANCSGHGVCNSNGHCHCDYGFAPPMCDVPGGGGSVDSGPTSPTEPSEYSQMCARNVTPTVRDLRDRNTYATALGSLAVIIAFIFLISIFYKIPSLFKNRADWKSSFGGIYRNISSNSVESVKEVSSDAEMNETNIEKKPTNLTSIQLKKQRKEEYMKMMKEKNYGYYSKNMPHS